MNQKPQKVRSKKCLQGRWTSSENQRFLKAYQKFGRCWSQIQKTVKTRTITQVRSHAQKVFIKREDHGLDPDSSSENSDFIDYEQSSPSVISRNKQLLCVPSDNYQQSYSRNPQHVQQAPIKAGFSQQKTHYQSELCSSPERAYFQIPSLEQLQQLMAGDSKPSFFIQFMAGNWQHFANGGSFL